MQKTNKKTILVFLVAVLLIFVLAVSCACNDKNNPNIEDEQPNVEDNNSNPTDKDKDKNEKDVAYSITVVRSSGDALKGVEITVNDSKEELVAYGVSGVDGKYEFTAKSATYSVVLGSLPKGYSAKDSYSVSADQPSIVIKLSASLIEKEAPKDTAYEIGSVVYDFSFTDTQGNNYSLSSIMQEKKAVLLNFWFINCGYCVAEFPAMKEAYLPYEEDLAIIGLNYVDSQVQAEQFRTNTLPGYDFKWDELPFIMVGQEQSCTATLANYFGVTGCPTSIMIDREGVVCFSVVGEGSKSDFADLFDTYTAEPYNQVIRFPGSDGGRDLPDVVPPLSEDIEAVLNNTESGFNATFRFDDDMYNWPWTATEDNDAFYATGKGHNNSYSIIYADVEADASQCIAFEYKISCEQDYDLFYVFVNGLLTHVFTGITDDWNTCYVYVPISSGNYTIGFAYIKDHSGADGDDTVYIRNLHFLDKDNIPVRTEVIYDCTSGNVVDSRFENYINAVYNETDGYYHVDSESGPLVLANLIGSSRWNKTSVSEYAQAGAFEDEALSDTLSKYCSFALSSRKYGYVAVNKELQYLLDKLVADKDENYFENTWLELCSFYKVYGTETPEEMEDPIKGFAGYNAFEAVLTVDPENPQYVEVNKDTIVMPRGLWYKFQPTESGIYNVKSVGPNATYVWIADEYGVIFDENDDDEHFSGDMEEMGNFYLTNFLEAGKTYYYLFDFDNPVALGKFEFVLRKVASSGKIWHSAAQEYTSGLDEEGNMNGVFYLKDAVDYVLGEDGYYHVKNEDGTAGAILYIDLYNFTNMFQSVSIEQMTKINCYYCMTCGSKYHTSEKEFLRETEHLCYICGETEEAKFELRKTFELPTALRGDNDELHFIVYTYGEDSYYVPMYVLNINNGYEMPDDIFEETAYLNYLAMYKIKFVDYTDRIEYYVQESMNNYPAEEEVMDTGSHQGCIAATPELVEILQKLILFGDYSFANIENAWLMLAYYYYEF